MVGTNGKGKPGTCLNFFILKVGKNIFMFKSQDICDYLERTYGKVKR